MSDFEAYRVCVYNNFGVTILIINFWTAYVS